MRRAKGILLIVAGGTLLSPLGFALGFYAFFRLQHVAVDIALEPRAYALLLLDIGLAAWLYVRGGALYRSMPSR